MVKDTYKYDPPETYKEVIKFPGIGSKMAYLYLQRYCDKIEGIAMNTHIHRVCNRIGWVDNKNEEQTRKSLQSWLPQESWEDANSLLSGLGLTICESRKPKCDECLLKNSCYFRLNSENNKTKTKDVSKSPVRHPIKKGAEVSKPKKKNKK